MQPQSSHGTDWKESSAARAGVCRVAWGGGQGRCPHTAPQAGRSNLRWGGAQKSGLPCEQRHRAQEVPELTPHHGTSPPLLKCCRRD